MNFIVDALHNLDPMEACDDRYAQGLVVGVVSVVMHDMAEDDPSFGFSDAIAEIAYLCPDHVKGSRLPVSWRDDFKNALHDVDKEIV